jgi:hypothetical protein
VACPIIYIVNRSTLASDADVLEATIAIQKQVVGDFSAAWDLDAKLIPVGKDGMVPADGWSIAVADTCDERDALGYHMDASVPSGIIGVNTSRDDGVPWSSVLSHEVLEMIADPYAEASIQAGGFMYALEVCDPVEASDSTYTIDGISLEPFVTPNWFRPGSLGPYDNRGVLSAPLQLARGGYCMQAPANGWRQLDGKSVRLAKLSAHPTSRRGRRARR